jgi:hypothetical protein
MAMNAITFARMKNVDSRADESSEPMKDDRKHHGSCHCGAVAFEVTGTIDLLDECNCSICTKKAYLHWIVPREAFRLLTPAENLATYSFNTGVAKHHFCPRCGVAPFYVPRSDPDKIDVNARCLDGVDLSALKIRRFDGRNWETAFRDQRGIQDSAAEVKRI